MWKLIGVSVLLIIGMTMQACAPKSQEDCGFVQNVYGQRISWKSQRPVQMYLHSSVPQEYVGAIVAAAQTWNMQAGEVLLQVITDRRIEGPISAQKDRLNVIYFYDTWEQDKLSEQARTSVYWVGDQIQEADMRINAAKINDNQIFSFYWSQAGAPQAVNIEALVLHEMGHVLGLKHKETGSSIMETYLASNTDRVKLAQTDVDSLKCEY